MDAWQLHLHPSTELMELPSKALTFKVSRKNPELIGPAGPTPHEFKPLSDIDDSGGLRLHPPFIAVYEGSPSMQGKDPVNIIRGAIAKALIFYYPLAGRLIEITNQKLVVDCTAEGVLFIEADADATVTDFDDLLHPPFPNIDQLLYNVPASDAITDCPLLLFQVTRLKCGGFVFAMRFNHTMSDGVGILQFCNAIAELARGEEAISVPPVWKRELLSGRNPPCVSCTHLEYDALPNSDEGGLPLMEVGDMEECSFLLSSTDIGTLRRSLPPHYQNCSQFDLITACAWRCRTMAVATDPNTEYRLLCIVNIRNKVNPPLPKGYYGNAVVATLAVATAKELCNNPLHHAIELVRNAKSKVTDDYVKSFMDLMMIRGRPSVILDHTFVVSDLGRFRLNEIDFGWGNAVYGGMAKGGSDAIPGVLSWFIPFKGNNGINGTIVPISLPAHSMQVFRNELHRMIDEACRGTIISNASAL